MAENERQTGRGAIVKRRWAIVPGRGGRAVILATVGAIALGAPSAGANAGQPSGQGGDQEQVVDEDDAGSETARDLA
jgi:hypothetical protein